jgi:hypothetical protein
VSDEHGYDEQLSLLEAEHGMERAREASRVQSWKRAADSWIRNLPRGVEFTADTMARAIGLPDELGSRERPNNVVGAYFSAKAKTGAIRWTGRYQRSQRIVGHGNLQRVWVKR